MFSPAKRIFQRYFVPAFFCSLYFVLRDKAWVSTKAKVQPTGNIRFGRGSVVKSFVVIQTSGGHISIGKQCAVSSFSHISAGDKDVVIGDYVRMGPHVTITGTTRKYRSRDQLIINQGYVDKGIRIGNDVFIGANSMILGGADIGDGAVVGVGSVVTRRVEPYSIVFGSPAKKIFERG